MDTTDSLQALALVASLEQVFAGNDETLKVACMSTMTPNAVRDFLGRIVCDDMDEARPWMRAIGEAFSKNLYVDFHPLLRAMPDRMSATCPSGTVLRRTKANNCEITASQCTGNPKKQSIWSWWQVPALSIGAPVLAAVIVGAVVKTGGRIVL